MKTFKGSLRIAATQDVVPAEFGVDEGILYVSTGGEALGNWPLDRLSLDDTGTEIRMVLDGEDVVVNVTDHDLFVAAIEPPRKRRRERRPKVKKERAPRDVRPSVERPPKVKKERAPRDVRPRVERSPKVKKERAPRDVRPSVERSPKVKKERAPRDIRGSIKRLLMRETWQDWLSNRRVKWSIASLAVIGVALLALFATNGLGVVLMLLGMLALVIAGLAVSEDLTAVAWMPAAISEGTLVIAGVVALVLGGLLTAVG